jgi:hypothetical protein
MKGGPSMKLEVNTKNSRDLYRMSPVPKEIPERLYHVTNRKANVSIMKEGIKPHELFGEIYFCVNVEDALMFAKTYRSYVISVDTSKLDPSLIRISHDHNREIYDFECYRYFKTVPLEAIVERLEVLQSPKLKGITTDNGLSLLLSASIK